MAGLGFEEMDYSSLVGRNCENVVGYVRVPVGVVGPLRINDSEYFVPIATTEGTLVASTQRGCRAIQSVRSTVLRDGMTRAPAVEMRDLDGVETLTNYLVDSFDELSDAFSETTSYGELKRILPFVAGRKVFLRMEASTGDAMGMNILSKGAEAVLLHLEDALSESGLTITSLSGNVCVDKKTSGVNWVLGRGKSVVSEAVVPKDTVSEVLKTDVSSVVRVATDKNLIGSALAGGSGGSQNAHASNVVSGIFLACGQDVAQTVESSSCLTVLEETRSGDLYVSCSMPSIEVGTIGGGTSLPSQSACLRLMGLDGPTPDTELGLGLGLGLRSSRLAQVVCSTVMCAELSLLSALASGDLVKSHMKFNR